jgi:DNA-binding beta-propeller fold protein YncE/cytochrome c peroxidase
MRLCHHHVHYAPSLFRLCKSAILALTGVAPLLALVACGSGLSETTFPTGSQTVVSSAEHTALYVVDEDGGKVHRYAAAGGGAVTSVTVGSRPSRLARVGDRVFVTLRGERALAELRDDGTKLSVVQTVKVGAEPLGIVAREDGTRLYVALSQEEAVIELDGGTLVETGRWSVVGQPSWLALHPSGDSLYVASALGGRLSRIDLGSPDADAVVTLHTPTPIGAGDNGQADLTLRLTGDPWVAPDGGSLAVPGLYVDNITTVDDPEDDEGVSSGGYASAPSTTVSRFNPAVLVSELGPSGGIQGDTNAIFLGGQSPANGGEFVRSYPTSATYSPSGDVLVVTMESSNTAILLSTQQVTSLDGDTGFCFDSGGGCGTSVGPAGFGRAAMIYSSTDAGPRGASFLDDNTLYVHDFLDRDVRKIGVKEGRSRLAARLGGSDSDLSGTMEGGEATTIHPSSLSEEEEEGRRMFYSALKSQMAADGAGVSCSTCHFEGRNDGLTWPFSNGVRNTPSLANKVAQTAPYTWTSQVSSIAAEAMITSQGRMGGESLSTADADRIEAFITTIPEVDHAQKGATSDAIARGKVIFERADVGCAGCHPAPLYADGDAHDLYGLSDVDTPSLVGLVATAPYLHSGSADTLREVLDSAVRKEMGDASMLTAGELDDLEAFLRTL